MEIVLGMLEIEIKIQGFLFLFALCIPKEIHVNKFVSRIDTSNTANFFFPNLNKCSKFILEFQVLKNSPEVPNLIPSQTSRLTRVSNGFQKKKPLPR